MKTEELIQIWKKTDIDVQFEIDKKELITELKNKVDKLGKNIFYRNVLEIGVSILFIPVFSYLFYEVPFYLFKLGCLVMVFWFIYIIIYILVVRKNKPSPEKHLTIIHRLKLEKAYLKKEIKLIRSVFYWYLLPPFIAQLFMILGLNFHRPVVLNNQVLNDILPSSILVQCLYILFLIGIYYWIYKKNNQAVEKNFKPILKELEILEYKLSNVKSTK